MRIRRKTRAYLFATCNVCGSYARSVALQATWPNGEVRPELVLCHVCARTVARRVPASEARR
jgi:hypothetical protein